MGSNGSTNINVMCVCQKSTSFDRKMTHTQTRHTHTAGNTPTAVHFRKIRDGEVENCTTPTCSQNKKIDYQIAIETRIDAGP